jgi:UDPglucose 6-dehydrogenase
MNIAIIGTGYVGLVTGVCLAAVGHTITCVDLKPEIVAQINRGRSPIYEAGLGELLAHAVAAGKLRATTEHRSAVLETEVTLICVGTPNGVSRVDLRQVISAAESVGAALADKAGYHVVAVKSTVLPGTTEEVVKSALEVCSGRRHGDGWGLCMNPEFLREGRAVEDFLAPDRVVIGALDDRAADALLAVYAHMDCPKIITSTRTAEMIKYVANSLFATMISFSNEIANLCTATPGINVREVWSGVHLDRRLTPVAAEAGRPAGLIEYLWHGLGFGGSCFPKDVTALSEFGREWGAPTPILDAVLSTNTAQPLRLIALLEREIEVAGQAVAVLGLTFKPGTDDLRESPALPVVAALRQRGACVIAHDPIAMPGAQQHAAFEGVTFAADWPSALKGADACCIVTAWPEYRAIRPEEFRRLMRHPLVIDGRGMFDPAALAAAGVTWRGIGFMPTTATGLRKKDDRAATTGENFAHKLSS